MNNLPSDKSVRNGSMWGTLSNLILLASIFSPILTILISFEPFILSLFPMFIWRKDRHKHPFIDETLTKATNFTLSICLYIFIACIISMISLMVGYVYEDRGTPPNPDLDPTLRSMIYNICIIRSTECCENIMSSYPVSYLVQLSGESSGPSTR